MDVPLPLPAGKNTPQRVLIVDESDDSREVLRTILSRRGIQIFETHERLAALAIAQQHHPDVIVLDVDEAAGDFDVCDEIYAQAKSDNTALVLLGRLPHGSEPSSRQTIAKPYHYGPLIRKIEELLAESDAAAYCTPRKAA